MSGVVLLPAIMMLVTTVTRSASAAEATFWRTLTSAAETSVVPGVQVCVIRTPRNPAATSRSICAFASIADVERTASSVAPISMLGPPVS